MAHERDQLIEKRNMHGIREQVSRTGCHTEKHPIDTGLPEAKKIILVTKGTIHIVDFFWGGDFTENADASICHVRRGPFLLSFEPRGAKWKHLLLYLYTAYSSALKT